MAPRSIHRTAAVALAGLMTAVILHLGASDHDHAMPLTANAQADPTCNAVPAGALPPARPIWCSPTNTGPPTNVNGANSWLDLWEHGLSNASLGAGYVESRFGGVGRTQHFRHLNHWMTDIEGNGGKGGSLMRPARSFTAEAGKLVIETEVATTIPSYNSAGGDLWPEIVVTTAAAPTTPRRDALYAYDEFANHWTFGCRLQRERTPICAMFDNSAGGPGQGARRYEISWFQHAGTTAFGGYPSTPGIGTAWKVCANESDPDVVCRNTFRLELTATSVLLKVNGVRYFEQTGLPPHLQNLVGGQPVHVYMADVVFGTNKVARFHWDRLAVNPGAVGPPPTATSTPTAMPTNTPTLTPTPSATCERRLYWGGVDTGIRQAATPAECGH